MKDCALGIVFSEDRSQVLLIKRRDTPIWVLPGGGIDDGELPARTAEREVFEESGLCVKGVRKTGEYFPINRLATRTHVFECKPNGGTLQPGEESLETAFFPLDSLPQPFLEIHLEWIHDALLNCSHVIQKPISSVTYWRVMKFFFLHPLIVLRALFARAGFPLNS
ncbi:NUDIX domain-containing protein [Parachlamydia sp. AcF125]|uniref:NUDIX hydrolase n=1 Tax=Parachlamydia sp. AcF125 TaxID=2795736 RepID=UPI001BC9E58E|nr:RNA pyrophosphohydrolase [Parachlamydia sp. AcF125]